MSYPVTLGPTSADWIGQAVADTGALLDASARPAASTRRVVEQGRLTSRQRFAAAKYDVIDKALSFMGGLKFKADGPEHAGVYIPARDFSGTWIHLSDLGELSDGAMVFAEPGVLDLWPIDARFGTPHGLHSVKTVDAKEVRGRVTRVMPRMLRHARAWIKGGCAHTSADYYGVRDDNTLVPITNPSKWGLVPVLTPEIVERLYVFAGWQLTAEYLWSVEIKTRDSNFAIRIPTYPEGALRLLSLRDVEPGAKRRKALRHWVSQHSRRIERDGEEVSRVEVKAHLRGVTPFAWEDFEGVVRPSAYDLRRWAGEAGGGA